MNKWICVAAGLAVGVVGGIVVKIASSEGAARQAATVSSDNGKIMTAAKVPNRPKGFAAKLVKAAKARVNPDIEYDGKYVRIGYPWGDVDPTTGVCTDVIVRSYRGLNIDLQYLVHRDMKRAFDRYPKQWGLKRPDKNIDHRRVPNLRRYFERHGQSFKPTTNAAAYKPGDIVTWKFPTGPHIGIVVDEINPLTGNPMVVHNYGWGVKMDDFLFLYPLTGHYRFHPKNVNHAHLKPK